MYIYIILLYILFRIKIYISINILLFFSEYRKQINSIKFLIAQSYKCKLKGVQSKFYEISLTSR